MRGQISETRSGEQNIAMGNNGAIIPVTIAQRIIKEVQDICPILSRATMYHVKGTLKIPVWGKANSTHDIAVSYHTEFTELTADAGKFTSVDLAGYLAGALTLMGRTVIKNADVDVVGFIVSHMAEKIAEFLEKELLVGTGSSAAQGITNTTNKKTIIYGDLSALSVNFRENIEMQLLQEKYATQHAVGVVAWFEFDAKVTEHQKVAVLEMGA